MPPFRKTSFIILLVYLKGSISFFPWDEMYRIILDFAPDVIFINQCELTSSIKALLIENNLSKIKLVTYCHYPALHINEIGNSVIDYTLNDSNIGQPILK